MCWSLRFVFFARSCVTTWIEWWGSVFLPRAQHRILLCLRSWIWLYHLKTWFPPLVTTTDAFEKDAPDEPCVSIYMCRFPGTKNNPTNSPPRSLNLPNSSRTATEYPASSPTSDCPARTHSCFSLCVWGQKHNTTVTGNIIPDWIMMRVPNVYYICGQGGAYIVWRPSGVIIEVESHWFRGIAFFMCNHVQISSLFHVESHSIEFRCRVFLVEPHSIAFRYHPFFMPNHIQSRSDNTIFMITFKFYLITFKFHIFDARSITFQ